MTKTINTALISTTARKIAGCCWDDTQAVNLIDKLREVRGIANLGSDGDLTAADRDAIDTLIGLVEGEEFTLRNYASGDTIRPATDAEVCDCAVAQANDGGVGAFEVDGVTCYVE